MERKLIGQSDAKQNMCMSQARIVCVSTSAVPGKPKPKVSVVPKARKNFFHKHITNTNNPNVSLLILAKERTARERMKINHTALAVLLAAAVLKTSQGFVPPVNRQSIAPLRVTTSLTDTTASPPPPTLQDFDSVTVPDFPELGRDGIYHLQNSNQHK